MNATALSSETRASGGTRMINFLEQLISEWYEFRGYFVRRNVRVGPRTTGGHESELDVVAFHPGKKHLVHVEPSSDAESWATRERRYRKKFDAGRKYIPGLFAGLDLPPNVDQIAVFIFGSRTRAEIAGGKVLMIADLMSEIRDEVSKRSVLRAAVPEQYQMLRALQFAAHYWKD
jgi:hypothetical protein